MTPNWQWIAGFFEGEGFIGWTAPKTPRSRQGVGARVVIGQKDRRPLAAVLRFVRDNGCPSATLYLRPPAKSRSSLGRPSAVWILMIQRREEVRLFLEAIAPMLYAKRRKAEQVIRLVAALQDRSESIVARARKLHAAGFMWHDIARQMRLRFTALKNMLVAAGEKVEAESTKADTTKRAKDRAKSAGRCIACYRPRGANGTANHCRQCADAINDYKRRRRVAK